MTHSERKLQQIKEALKKEFNPKRLFLFGSRARGDNHNASDYDLVIVDSDSNLSKFESMQRASDVLYPLGVSADVFFYTEDEFNSWKNEFSSIPELVLREGRELDLG